MRRSRSRRHRAARAPTPMRWVRARSAEDRAAASGGDRPVLDRRARASFQVGGARPGCHDARSWRLSLSCRHSRRALRRLYDPGQARWWPCPRVALHGEDRLRVRRIDKPMTKKRVHEIAKEQGLSSKELLEKLKAAGVEAKAAASSVEETVALQALGSNGAAANGAPAKAQATKSPTATMTPPAAKAPPGAGCRQAICPATCRPDPRRSSGCHTTPQRIANRPGGSPGSERRHRAGYPSPSGRGSRRRARAPNTRLSHGRASTRRYRAGRAQARGDRLPGVPSSAGRPGQSAPASSPPWPPPARHL